MSGFLAEEDQFDRRSLWRLGSWGVGAVGAVVVAVLAANQSSIGLRHEQFASADLARQAQQFQLIAKQSQNETRRLASAIDTLNGDRDRLYSRITVLEQGLDSVTGSIARQNAAAGSPQAAPQSSSIVPSSIVPSSPSSSTPVSSSTLPPSPVAPSTTTSVSAPSSAPSAPATSAPGSLWPASPAKAEPPVTQSAAPAVAPVATAAAAKDAAISDKSPPVAAASEPASVTAAPPPRPIASERAGNAADAREIDHGSAGRGGRKTDGSRYTAGNRRSGARPRGGRRDDVIGLSDCVPMARLPTPRQTTPRTTHRRRPRSSEPNLPLTSEPRIRSAACARSGGACSNRNRMRRWRLYGRSSW